jgi:hypothetical protein
MAQFYPKYKTSQYKYVTIECSGEQEYFVLNMKGVSRKRYKTEKQAAIAADMQLIKQGKPPVNILKKL